MNETDTRAKLIDPALRAAGWSEDQISREHVVGRFRIDYVLRLISGGPIVAVLEAKAEARDVMPAVDQAINYARLVGSDWAMASNAIGSWWSGW
jgi:type I restriction enzyme, R subunit